MIQRRDGFTNSLFEELSRQHSELAELRRQVGALGREATQVRDGVRRALGQLEAEIGTDYTPERPEGPRRRVDEFLGRQSDLWADGHS